MEGESVAPDRGMARSIEGDGEWSALLRYAHIFSSAVREILEDRLLQDVSGNGLRLPEFHLLRFLALCTAPPQIHDIARFLGVTPPAATKQVDRLERLAMVRRGACEGDRRVTLLELTEHGRELVEKHESVERERLASILFSFTLEEIAVLARLLERSSVALIEEARASSRLCLRCAAYFDDDCPVQFLEPGCPYQRAARNRPAETH